MAIPVQQFQPLTLDQTNPVMAGMQSANSIYNGLLKNHEQRVANKYQDKTLQEQLQKMQFDNKILGEQSKFAPQNALADALYNQSRAPHMNAETRLIGQQSQYYPREAEARIRAANSGANYQDQESKYYGRKAEADINHTLAQTGLLGAQTQLEPMNARARLLNAMAKGTQANASTSNNFRMWSQTPIGLKIISEDPKLAEAIYSDMQRAAGIVGGYEQQNNKTVDEQPQQQPQTQQPQMQNSSAIGQEIQLPQGSLNPYSSMQNSLVNSLSTPNSQPSMSVPQQDLAKPTLKKDIIKEIQTAALDTYVNKNWPSDIKKRIYAGDRFKETVPEVLDNFEKSKNYFSLEGQKQLKIDQGNALTKKIVTPQLQAYRNFVQGIEQLNVQGAMLEGVPADQISRGDYKKIYDLHEFANNAEGAKSSLNNAIYLGLKGDKANHKSPGSLMQDSNQDLNQSVMPNLPSNSPAKRDLSHLSDDELEKRMRDKQ